jgi:hypothetical protein
MLQLLQALVSVNVAKVSSGWRSSKTSSGFDKLQEI